MQSTLSPAGKKPSNQVLKLDHMEIGGKGLEKKNKRGGRGKWHSVALVLQTVFTGEKWIWKLRKNEEIY